MSKEERVYFPANVFRRIVSFAIDALIASLPCLVVLFLATGSLADSWLAIVYPFPIEGTVLWAMEVPPAVEDRVTTETVGTDIEGNAVEGVALSTKKVPNVSLEATFCRLVGLLSVVWFLIYTPMCSAMYGRTVGKKAMGLFLQSNDKKIQGKKAWTKQILLREIVGKVLLSSTGILPVLSIFTMIFTKKHLAIHDMIFKTMIRE